VIQLVPLALEELILNAQFVTLQLLLWPMEMNAEEFAQQDSFGDQQIIHANYACPLVLIVLGLELMIAIVA
jgi:hypothetical protein